MARYRVLALVLCLSLSGCYHGHYHWHGKRYGHRHYHHDASDDRRQYAKERQERRRERHIHITSPTRDLSLRPVELRPLRGSVGTGAHRRSAGPYRLHERP